MTYTNKFIEGAGISLRTPHIYQILEDKPDIPWLEILADNFLIGGGLNKKLLEQIRESYPITMHCVGMSLGSTEPLDYKYLQQVKTLATDFEVSWISDHICFTSAGGSHAHDLLPLPYTEEALENITSRICQVQDFLGQQILVENATSYIQYNHNTLSEADFINELVIKANCHLLFDVNNVYVNEQNLNKSAIELIEQLPLEHIKQIHLAGFEKQNNVLIDTHGAKVSDPVWALFTELQKRKPGIATQIEWDNNIPELPVLLKEANKAQTIINLALNTA